MAIERRRRHVQPIPEEALGRAIREFRRAQDLSQEGLAAEAGVDRTYISMLERGLKSPTVRMLFKLVGILRAPPSELLRRAETIIAEAVSSQKVRR